MLGVLVGILGFFLFFLYDWNSVKKNARLLHHSFWFGCCCLVGGTGWLIWQRLDQGGTCSWFWLVLAAISLALEVYTLFFALPFTETYVRQNGKPVVYDGGVYALCRHPGVLWLALFYLFLWLAFGGIWLLAAAVVFTGLDVAYVVLQDRWTFPRTFTDYGEYQKSTPFLLPTGASIKRCVHTLRGKK